MRKIQKTARNRKAAARITLDCILSSLPKDLKNVRYFAIICEAPTQR
jgi:hypothetical protein